MAAEKKPLDESVAGAIRAHQKAQIRVAETAADLKRALKAAVKEERLTKKQADDITRTFAKE